MSEGKRVKVSVAPGQRWSWRGRGEREDIIVVGAVRKVLRGDPPKEVWLWKVRYVSEEPDDAFLLAETTLRKEWGFVS